MEDKYLKQITRQLKFLNIWITIFGTLILVSLIIGGYFLYQFIAFANDSIQSINNFQAKAENSLDVKAQLCKDENEGSLFQRTTNLCK